MKPVDWFSFISKTLKNDYPKDVSEKKNYPKVQLYEQVLISITAKLTCKLGKQMSYEKVSKELRHALRSGAYQLYRHLTISSIGTNFFTRGSAKINIITKSAIYITGRNTKYRIQCADFDAHFHVKDIINCLAAVFCRFPNLNYLQTSERNQVILKNCIERAMQMANCNKPAFKIIGIGISEAHNNRIRYDILPFFANSVTDLNIRNIPPLDVNSVALLIKSTKELNLRSVTIRLRGFSIPRNNWLPQAFGHMDKLIHVGITSVNSSFSFIPTRENMDFVFKLKYFALTLFKTRSDETIRSFIQLSKQVPNTTKLSLVFGLLAYNSRNFKIRPMKLISDIKFALLLSSVYPNLNMYIYIVTQDKIESAREENLKKIIIDAFESVKNDSEFAAVWLPKFTSTQACVAEPRSVCVEFKCGSAKCSLQTSLNFNDLCFVADL